MKRREGREKILQCLFQIDFTGEKNEQLVSRFVEEDNLSQKELEFIETRIDGTIANLIEIDNEISKYLKDWTIERLPNVDKAILRMSVYEIMYVKDISYKIILNEAIELAKDYSTEESSKFINGILGSFVREYLDINDDEQN